MHVQVFLPLLVSALKVALLAGCCTPNMMTVVVPSPTSSSCVRLSSIMLFAAGCDTSISLRIACPSFVRTMPPMGSRSILSIALGPRHDRMISATLYVLVGADHSLEQWDLTSWQQQYHERVHRVSQSTPFLLCLFLVLQDDLEVIQQLSWQILPTIKYAQKGIYQLVSWVPNAR